MKLAIMQPYLFPYLGYFQLVAAVDTFVFYDDVNFIKNGWINRNRLVLAGEVRYITVPLAGASPYRKINQVGVQPPELWQRKVLESIRQSYARAPFFAPVFALVSQVLTHGGSEIGEMAKASILAVAGYLNVHARFVDSSSVYANGALSGTDRVLDICRQERATHYVNLPGGRALYAASPFHAQGLELGFVDTRLPTYPQFSKSFQPGLSIIDVLMFNSPEASRSLLAAEVLP